MNERTAVSKRGMVVAAHPIAAQAGIQVLRDGGKAADAAIAVALTIGVVEPYASGLGGGGFMMICPHGDLSNIIILDSRGKVPSLLTRERFYSSGGPIPWCPYSGPMSVAIPGLGRALQRIQQRFATLPLDRLAAPAIAAAEDGFEVTESYRHCSQMFEGTMRVDEELCRIFMKDGRIMQPGEHLVQPDMARTLRTIARDGFEAIYEGPIGQAMLKAVNHTGPVWDASDLGAYEVKERRPLCCEIAGYEVFVTPPPSRGGAGVLLACRAYLQGLKPDHNSPAAVASYARIFPAVFRALDPLIGDPDEFVIPDSMILAEDILERAPQSLLSPREAGNTTHFTIVDHEGTIVTASQTIEHFFGSGICANGTGIVLNNDITDMSSTPDHMNSVSANRRSVANMSPMIIAKNGRACFALGTPGSLRITSALAQTTINLIGYGMSLEEAVAAPRLHWEGGRLYIEGGIDVSDVDAGMPLLRRRFNDLFFGGVHAAAMDPDGTLHGVADPRRDGVAIGY